MAMSAKRFEDVCIYRDKYPRNREEAEEYAAHVVQTIGHTMYVYEERSAIDEEGRWRTADWPPPYTVAVYHSPVGPRDVTPEATVLRHAHIDRLRAINPNHPLIPQLTWTPEPTQLPRSR